MEWQEDHGRIFHPLQVYSGMHVKPWNFGINNKIEPNIIYQLGGTFPFGYWRGNQDRFQQPTGLFIRHSLATNKSILKIKGLSLGAFDVDNKEPFSQWDQFRDEYEITDYIQNKTCEFIIDRGRKFTELTHLILGNYYMDDYEHTFYSVNLFHELIENFPKIEHLLVRGGFGHSPKTHRDKFIHTNLKSLTIQTFGFSNAYLNQILRTYEFPNLNYLEIHLGTEYYGGTDKIYPFTDLFAGKYPSLKHLGLIDSDITEEIAYELAHSSVIEQLDSLDFSYGSLTDEGLDIFLNSPKIKSLKKLKLHSNHLTEEFLDELAAKKLGFLIDFGTQKGDMEKRYWMIRE